MAGNHGVLNPNILIFDPFVVESICFLYPVYHEHNLLRLLVEGLFSSRFNTKDGSPSVGLKFISFFRQLMYL